MKKLSTLILSSAIFGVSIGQTIDMGGPITSHTKYSFSDVKSMEVMPEFDLDQAITTSTANYENKVGPFMFGFEHQVNYDLVNAGKWITLSNGDRVWRLRIKSDGALSLNFVFGEYWLPEGASLYLYNEDKSMVVGAYTSKNNNENNQLGTDLVKGEDVTLEYYEPAAVANQGRLHLTNVVHGYYDINGWYSEKVNESGACNLDVVCPAGDDWRSEIRSVARIVVGGGLCSGTLVNNTAQDGTPYFLTANHCGPQNMGSAVFRFNYDSPVCGSQTSANSQAPSGNNTVNGSSLKARNADSDFGLVELNSTPPATYNVYYAGWNHSGAIPQTAVGIHHPSGDVKKISFDDDVLQSASGLSSVANSEWRIEAWERNTTTEGGSSGSGLWDENHYIIGQLHGGQATCSNSVNDYYGKFAMSWDGNGSSSSSARLMDWLDPQSTGVATLNGYDPNQPLVDYDAGLSNTLVTGTLCSGVYEPQVTLKNSGSQTMTSCTILYNLDGGTNNVYNWTGSLISNATEVVNLGSLAVVGTGNHTFNATVSDPNGQSDQNFGNDVVADDFVAVPNSMPIYLDLLVDCYGEEVAWTLKPQGSSMVLFSGGSYPGGGSTPVANGTQVTEEMCLSNGCYTFEITDSYGDGMSGSQYSSCNTDGDYQLEDYYGNVFFSMAQSNYGYGISHDFCVSTVGVDENDFSNSLQVYPNPSQGQFVIMIENEEVEVSEIQIMDARGAIVLRPLSVTVNGKIQVDAQDLSKGVYFVSVVTSSGTAVKKIVLK